MLFKGVSYLQLWRSFCSVELDHLFNIDRELYEEHFCEIILNLVKEEMSFKDISIFYLAAILFEGAEPFVLFW